MDFYRKETMTRFCTRILLIIIITDFEQTFQIAGDLSNVERFTRALREGN